MVDYAEMSYEDRIAMRDYLLKEKRLRKRKDIAKTTLSKILKMDKKELPASKEELNEMGLDEKKVEKINNIAKYAY